MEYIINNERLISEWNWEKNLELKLDPAKTLTKSGKKAWWTCCNGHSYYSSIEHRTEGIGCPYCSGRFPVVGVSDLQTTNPILASEWNYNKNKNLTPQDVKSGTNKKVWWTCSNGHEWEASISSRHSGKGCPYCSGRYAIKGETDLETTRPDLLSIWNYKKNISTSPDAITAGSGQKVWWIGSCGHEWDARIHDVAKKDEINCPYCTGKRVLTGFNDLRTKNPDIASEWNYERNHNLSPEKVAEHSNKKVWWKCEKGHEWESVVSNRAYGEGCPYCSGRRLITGENDLQTVNPYLSKEWDYEKNYPITPRDVMPYTNEKYWWICEHGHSWRASVNSRSYGSGCQKCSGETKTSFPEQSVLFYLSQKTQAYNRKLVFDKEIDIWLPELSAGVEYCGSHWHPDRKRDKRKADYFRQHGIKIFNIYDYCENNTINNSIIECRYHNRNIQDLEWAIVALFDILHIEKPDINIERDRTLIYEQYIISTKQNSLLVKRPNIALEWHPTKNGKLTPDMVSYGSNKNVWWLCSKCNCEYATSVKAKVKSKHSCPICYRKSIGAARSKIVLQLDDNNTLLKIWRNISLATKALHINNSHIGLCCSNQRQHAGGYRWCYLYDQTRKDGTLIPGAITLGLITEAEALAQLNTPQND